MRWNSADGWYRREAGERMRHVQRNAALRVISVTLRAATGSVNATTRSRALFAKTTDIEEQWAREQCGGGRYARMSPDYWYFITPMIYDWLLRHFRHYATRRYAADDYAITLLPPCRCYYCLLTIFHAAPHYLRHYMPALNAFFVAELPPLHFIYWWFHYYADMLYIAAILSDAFIIFRRWWCWCLITPFRYYADPRARRWPLLLMMPLPV